MCQGVDRGLGRLGGNHLGKVTGFLKAKIPVENWRTNPQNISTALGCIPVVVLVYKEKSIEKCLDFEWIFLIGKVWDAGIPGFI